MKKPLLLLSAAVLLAVPSSANAAAVISAGPIKAKGGYKGELVAIDGKQDVLTITLWKIGKKSSQSHSYTFDKVKVTPTSIRGSLGKYGSVNLRLSNAKNVKSKLPKGCTGKVGTTRTGTLTGSLRLKADTNYFKTIRASRLTGANTVLGGKLKCSGAGDDTAKGDGSGDGATPGEPMLTHNRTDERGTVSFTATRSSQWGMVTEPLEKTKPAIVMHNIAGTGTGLILAGGGAEVPGVGTFIGGKGTFAALAGMPAGSPYIPGTLSGDLALKFHSIGSVPIVGDAMLLNAV